MRKRFLVLAFTFGSLLLVLSTSNVLAAPAPSAPKGGTHLVTTTTSGQEILPVSAEECAARKAGNPNLANDPRLCQDIHGWTETDTRTVDNANAVQPATGSCYVGTRSFHDYVSNFWWEYDLDTTFNYHNTSSCNTIPNLDRETCWRNYVKNTDITQEKCYTYAYQSSAGWGSRAAVDTVWIVEHWPGGNSQGYYKSQRRECYSDNADRCTWANWDGI